MDGMETVLVKLEAMQTQLVRVEARIEHLSAAHHAHVQREWEREVEREGRFTKIESSVNVRSWMGAVGIAASAMLAAMGFPMNKL